MPQPPPSQLDATPPRPPRKMAAVRSITREQIDSFWRRKKMDEEEHLLAAQKAAARIRAKSLRARISFLYWLDIYHLSYLLHRTHVLSLISAICVHDGRILSRIGWNCWETLLSISCAIELGSDVKTIRFLFAQEDDYHRFQALLKEIIIDGNNNSDKEGKEDDVANDKESRIGIKDWWTKSKYAYLNQPSIKSMDDKPLKQNSTYIPQKACFNTTSFRVV
ncbi:uncharacterized protein LOC109707117 isoform X1 [Ananas comosus]|uniref:Uncharacterized protein LOC109707117 isoform X1 n=1 Tax=Ananas comosus TaxID=4615 RepID=A0A6P5EK57_ANACO|nr:uncharacterized protein LOC109707117 isoform X1 [Ananas comosus]